MFALQLKFFLLAVITTTIVTFGHGQTVNTNNQSYFVTLGFVGPKPNFAKKFYIAKIHNDVLVQIDDGPIIFENCEVVATTFKLILDESKYHPVLSPPPAYPSIGKCSVLINHIILRRNATEADRIFLDVIKLQAIHEDCVIAETHIVVLSDNYVDPYRLSYSYNGTEYIILNYFYFKVFLGIIFFTAIAILLTEIREIYIKCKGQRYIELNNSINYI